MNILVYLGTFRNKFSKALWDQWGGNGALNQAIEMAEQLAAQGHKVTVSGDVDPSQDGNLSFVHRQKLGRGAHFDLVIAHNYIHYVMELSDQGITWDKSAFVVHHHHHFPWWRGELLPNRGAAVFHDPRLTYVVLQSESHKKSYLSDNPGASRKACVIGNALDPKDWDLQGATKVANRFIFTSGNLKTLKMLYAAWPVIKREAPDAVLHVAMPVGTELPDDLPDLDGIKHLGPLPAPKLREEILAAEYWINPSRFMEEFGLSALEMMMGGVKIVSTAYGNLHDLLEGRATVIPGQDDLLTETLDAWRACRDNPVAASEHVKAARAYAETHAWETRITDWLALAAQEPKPTCKYPELYTYFDDPEAWEERFVAYATRTKEWDLIVDEPVADVFSFPVFTEEFCEKIREEAEFSECWTTDRHYYYPTTDMLLDVLGLRETYDAILNKYIYPCAKALWHLPQNSWRNLEAETFLAKYTAKAQGHLSLHHDDSDLTCLIQLSRLTEYEGGGTYFDRQKAVHKADIGYASLHPGRITHRHGGRAVSKGERYILVSFIKR